MYEEEDDELGTGQIAGLRNNSPNGYSQYCQPTKKRKESPREDDVDSGDDEALS